ncbi:hypothetical protein EUTSA_v10027608mg [Eutrema salsugineum]|uniref:Uncharacterized protein n=1 Tax=Eutrema salsugineum TaxID=72664 RepID=V4M066_EUTSA|nr:hypothetical protein EUTSA_v10027608mg [Eutrema salsugineum]
MICFVAFEGRYEGTLTDIAPAWCYGLDEPGAARNYLAPFVINLQCYFDRWLLYEVFEHEITLVPCSFPFSC